MSNFTINTTTTSSTGMPVKYLPTGDAYDAWASVYDTDGNILCAMDDLQLAKLLPQFVDELLAGTGQTSRLTIADVGCGTGRNTIALLRCLKERSLPAAVDVTGIDLSEGMLAIAREKVNAWRSSNAVPVTSSLTCTLKQSDIFNGSTTGTTNPPPNSQDAIISTLVLEHLPAQLYFDTLFALLKPGGTAIITNMHSDMGSRAQAGFAMRDGETGEMVKVRGTSFAHTNEQVVSAAEQTGFEVLRVMEQAVEEGMDGVRAAKWIGVKVWAGYLVRKGS